MVDKILIKIPSNPKYLTIVRSVTEKVCSLFSFKRELMEEFKHAIDEACSNVIKYAYGFDSTKDIIIKFKVSKDRFMVVIEDKGKKANIEMIKGRALEEVKPGGLGVHFIKRVFDVYKFDSRKKIGNRLILIRELKSKNRIIK